MRVCNGYLRYARQADVINGVRVGMPLYPEMKEDKSRNLRPFCEVISGGTVREHLDMNQ